jgi:hypothetical protein
VKFTLKAGAELDVLTPDEAREIVLDMLERAREQQETPERAGASGRTDGAGALALRVYAVPLGREFSLHRLVVDAEGFTPGAPFTNAAGYIDIRRSGVRVDFVNLSVGIPALALDGNDTAIRFRNGEEVEIVIAGGPASTNVRAEIQGMLREPLPDGQRGRTRRVR